MLRQSSSGTGCSWPASQVNLQVWMCLNLQGKNPKAVSWDVFNFAHGACMMGRVEQCSPSLHLPRLFGILTR